MTVGAYRIIPDGEVLKQQARDMGYTSAAEHGRAIEGVQVQTLQKALSQQPWGPTLKAIYAANRDKRRLVEAKADDEITVTTEVPAAETVDLDPDSDQVKQFALERGIPLDQWAAVDVQARRYPVVPETGTVIDAQYLSVKFKPLKGMVVLNVAAPQKPRTRKPLKPRKGEPTVVVLAGCHQVPFHSDEAHELMCGFLDMVQPHKVGLLGDFCDYPDVSKYQTNPAYRASVQDTHVIAHRMLNDIVSSAPTAEIEMCKGNHDQRLEDWLLKHAGPVHDVRRHGSEVPWHHPRELLGLDALGITHHDPVGGQWSRARIQYSPIFAAMHGWRTGKATAARDTARELGMHVAQVHTHRQAIAPVTIGRDGDGYMVQAVECGAMCKVDEGMGHTSGVADWQQGFCLASMWPDGVPSFELVQIVDGALRFRGQRLSPRMLKVAA